MDSNGRKRWKISTKLIPYNDYCHFKLNTMDNKNNVEFVNDPLTLLKMSPLQLDIIISQIQKLLPLIDLKTCRLVSIQWNFHATDILKRRRPIITFNSRKSTRSNSCCQKIKEFTSVMKSSSDIPYCAYKLTNISLGNPIVQEFFDVCCHSNSIRVLTLDLSKKCVKSSEFKSILIRLALTLEVLDIDYLSSLVTNPATKNLFPDSSTAEHPKTLRIKKVSFPACKARYCPDFWRSIFKASEDLEEINSNYAEQTTPLLNALTDSNRLRQLSRLRLEYIGKEHMDSFLASDIRVTEFKFNIISKDVSGKKLEELLKKLSTHLTVLAMGSPSENGKMILRFPRMQKLRRLGLFHCDDSLITLEGIRFSQDCPSLQSLELSSGIKNLDWQEYLSLMTNVGSPPCETVKELSIGLLVSDPQCVHYLGRTFPNVICLSLEFPRKDFLQAVWTTWGDLEELILYFHVHNDDSKDRFICGIPTEWKENIKMNVNLSNPDWWKNIDPPSTLDGHSICNLTSLQRLTIEQSPNSGIVSDLTDFSVFFGFAKLRNLRVLKIGRSQISHACQQFLRTALPMISHLDIRDERGPGVFSSEERDELVSYIKYYEDMPEYDEQE